VRSVAVVTAARSDYGPLRPVLDALEREPALEPLLVVAGAHLDGRLGGSLAEIEADGRAPAARVETAEDDDSPLAAVRSSARGVGGFGEAFERLRPDLVLVLGDRFEIHAAASAALPLRIPVAHLHGGESSEGAFDESLRHSVTKLSHLHFAATERYARRIVQMGEEPWRVIVSGAPGLDAALRLDPLPLPELEERVGLSLAEPTLLVTYHPPTLADAPLDELEQLLAALERRPEQLLFTAPNADPGGRAILERVRGFVGGRAGARLVDSLGSRAYLTLLRHVAAMVGNSSSGIVEAASFELPVVDVGTRQQGRVRGANVIECAGTAAEIERALERALSPGLRASLAGLENPYGDGRAAERIVGRLREVPLGRELLVKRFHEVSW